MNIDEIRSAYDHARDFLAEDATLHNLTSIERALCESVIGMYEVICERDRTMEYWRNLAISQREDADAEVDRLQYENVIMREALQWYGDFQHYMYQMSHGGIYSIDYDKGKRAREALAKVGDKSC